jgi:hypothetical protein
MGCVQGHCNSLTQGPHKRGRTRRVIVCNRRRYPPKEFESDRSVDSVKNQVLRLRGGSGRVKKVPKLTQSSTIYSEDAMDRLKKNILRVSITLSF